MISTSICKASRIQVGEVSFIQSRDGEHVIAAQSVIVTDRHGQEISIEILLEEGCTTLACGEAVVFPALDALTN